MTKHTPSPWSTGSVANKRGWRDNLMVYSSDGVLIANCEAPKQRENELRYVRGLDEDYANARLIAAAPALLDALKGLAFRATVQDGGCWCPCAPDDDQPHTRSCERARRAVALVNEEAAP